MGIMVIKFVKKNQLDLSQVADWSICGLVNLPTANC